VDGNQTATRRRVTVPDAARLLGISVEAVRGRIKRDTLEHAKAPDGTVYVLLDANQPRPAADQSNDQALLIARLENEVQFLREELARKDAIMLNMTESMRQLTAPNQEPQESAESVAEESERAEPLRSGAPGPQERISRPWWRRVFRGR
jgi:hypothetical protein